MPETEAALLAHTPPPAWTFLTGPLSHASSTAIRNKSKAQPGPVARRSPPETLPWKKAKDGTDEAPPPLPAEAASPGS
jgi:hypothetical protein